MQVVNINDPIKMLNSVVILFKDPDSKDSEVFENAAVESIDVTIEGKLNIIYERGIRREDIYREASRLFGTRN